jgi:excisionase family DNA binding protein
MKTTTDLDPLAYGIIQACRLTGVGRTKLYAAIKRRELIARKVGRRTVITAQALSDWIESLPVKETHNV